MTPLHLAVKAGNIRFAKDLLLRGADRDAETVDGQKPIQMVPLGDDVMKKKFTGILVSLNIGHSIATIYRVNHGTLALQSVACYPTCRLKGIIARPGSFWCFSYTSSSHRL